MSDKMAPCGALCTKCPVYEKNVTGRDYQQQVSDRIFEFYGFRIESEKVWCEGCIASGKKLKIVNPDCKIRQCVAERKIVNCAQCPEYPCESMQKRFEHTEAAEKRFLNTITVEDYLLYFMPYLCRKNLEQWKNGQRELS
jgi:hypothetical protein